MIYKVIACHRSVVDGVKQFLDFKSVKIDCVTVRRVGEKPLFVWGKTDKQLPIHSITKTIVGLLVGIALGRRSEETCIMTLLSSEDQAILRGSPLETLTLKQCLTMQTGIPWNEQGNSYNTLHNDAFLFYSGTQGKKHLAYLVEKAKKGLDRKTFNYNGGLTFLVGRIVEHLSGNSIDCFADKALFQPLGIRKDWEMDPEIRVMSSGIRMTGEELSRIGELILEDGRFNGNQVVASEWIQRMFDVHVPRAQLGAGSENFYGFGYHSWRCDVETDKGRVPIFAGIGTGGQRLCLIPRDRLIMTVHSSHTDAALMSSSLTPQEKKILDLQSVHLLLAHILPNLGYRPSLPTRGFDLFLESVRAKLRH